MARAALRPHRGRDHPTGSGRPRDLSDFAANWRLAAARSESELWREFEIARHRILGALLDAAVHGLRAMGRVHVDRLPRMADFALWATACETALWPAGTVARAYAANRKAAIESIIEADPVATCVRALMIDRTMWTGSASELSRLCAELLTAGG
jgi:hypothetical protein